MPPKRSFSLCFTWAHALRLQFGGRHVEMRGEFFIQVGIGAAIPLVEEPCEEDTK
jgi:hypothetical protein